MEKQKTGDKNELKAERESQFDTKQLKMEDISPQK